MLIAIVLDRPLPEAQALVDNPHEFLKEITRVLADQQILFQRVVQQQEISVTARFCRKGCWVNWHGKGVKLPDVATQCFFSDFSRACRFFANVGLCFSHILLQGVARLWLYVFPVPD